MKKSSGEIKVFCTIDPTELTKVGKEYYCNKCSHTLVNVAEESKIQRTRIPASNLICGFVSALSLTSCSTHHATNTTNDSGINITNDSGIRPSNNNSNSTIDKTLKPKEDIDIPIPGTYYSSEDFDTKGKKYPIAKPVTGKVGFVESPFGGHHIDVSHLPEGSLAMDPNYPMTDRKIFKIKMSNKSQ